MGEVFEHVAREPIQRLNSLVIASDAPLTADALRDAPVPRELQPLALESAGRLAPALRGGDGVHRRPRAGRVADRRLDRGVRGRMTKTRWGFVELVIFVAGISTLGAEIAAARLVAPAFGASTVVWANTIAIVLVALAGGYWLGGRLADRHPHAPGMARAALLGAGLVALIPLVAIPLLDVTEDSLDELPGSLLALLVLVGPPVLVLGALSPWAIRLRVRSVAGAGDVDRAAVRAVHRRRAGRQLRRRARADPAGRHTLDVPDLRGAAGRGVRPGGMVLQACLNGDRDAGVPLTPEELAADARACVARRRGLDPRPPARRGRPRDARSGRHRRGRARAAAVARRDLAHDRPVDHGRRRRRARRGRSRAGRSGPTSSR